VVSYGEMENVSQPQPMPQPVPTQHEVGFPTPRESQNGGKGKAVKWIIVIVGLVVIVGGGILFLANSQSESTSVSSPTPQGGSLSTFPTPEPTVAPTFSPTPAAEPVDKSEIKIEVLNGTGVAGGAGFLKSALEEIDFSEIEVGNADSQTATSTSVTYARDLSTVISDDITAKLEELYESVETKVGAVSGGFDVRIITGERKASAATSSSTPKPTASPSL